MECSGACQAAAHARQSSAQHGAGVGVAPPALAEVAALRQVRPPEVRLDDLDQVADQRELGLELRGGGRADDGAGGRSGGDGLSTRRGVCRESVRSGVQSPRALVPARPPAARVPRCALTVVDRGPRLHGGRDLLGFVCHRCRRLSVWYPSSDAGGLGRASKFLEVQAEVQR